jgi:hypothetical protein
MNAPLNNRLAPIEVLSEGRRYQRFVKEGAVALTFRGQTVTGNLVNLSVAGLLAVFSSKDPLPGMSEEVDMRLEAGGKDNIIGLHGMVVRIQMPREYEQQDLIEIAVNFGDLLPAAKHGLQKLIKYLLGKTIRYK